MAKFYFFTNGKVKGGKVEVIKVNRITFDFEKMKVPYTKVPELLQNNISAVKG